MTPELLRRLIKLLGEMTEATPDCRLTVRSDGSWQCHMHDWYGDEGDRCGIAEAKTLYEELVKLAPLE